MPTKKSARLFLQDFGLLDNHDMTGCFGSCNLGRKLRNLSRVGFKVKRDDISIIGLWRVNYVNEPLGCDAQLIYRFYILRKI
jgi:hypothetical protein